MIIIISIVTRDACTKVVCGYGCDGIVVAAQEKYNILGIVNMNTVKRNDVNRRGR